MDTIRIRVIDPRGLHHDASGFHAWDPGQEYDFPGDPKYRAWLEGKIQAREALLVGPGAPAEAPQPASPAGGADDAEDTEAPEADPLCSFVNPKTNKPCRSHRVRGTERCARHREGS